MALTFEIFCWDVIWSVWKLKTNRMECGDHACQTNFGSWRPIPLDYTVDLTFENLVILLC